jgi:hypothetical protein
MSTISCTEKAAIVTREGSGSRQMRQRIAQLAARMMAEDGIEDFGTAKRKAARQAGAPDTRNLPDNSEVEAALNEYLQLYQTVEQGQRVDELRRDALELMQWLDGFQPHLVGAALSGQAGRYAEVDLHAFADSPKDLELFLINRGLDFTCREMRFWVAGEARAVPVYEIDGPRSGARIAVFERRDLRHPVRSSQDGRPMDRAGPDRLREIIRSSVSGSNP